MHSIRGDPLTHSRLGVSGMSRPGFQLHRDEVGWWYPFRLTGSRLQPERHVRDDRIDEHGVAITGWESVNENFQRPDSSNRCTWVISVADPQVTSGTAVVGVELNGTL